MKLLICTRSSTVCGGVESIQNALCRQLPKQGWEVRLALAKGARFNRPERYAEAYPDLPVVEIDGTGGTRQARLEACAKILRQEQPDIVLNMRLFDVYEAVARYRRERPEVRFVAGVRCFEAPLIYDVRRYRECVDAFVTSGELVALCCREWAGVEAARVENIPGGVKVPVMALREEEGVQQPVRLGYVGRIEQYQKRIFDLMGVFEALDAEGLDYRFEVVGSGPDEAALTRQLKPWLQAGKVRMRGFMSEEALYREVYSQLDICLHFAHTEGVTMAPREAMLHGVVPVVSRFCGLETEGVYRNEENALTFPVGDVRGAAEAVLRLCRAPELYRRLSRACRLSQQGKYSFDGAIDAWEGVFQRVMALPPKRGKVPELEDWESGRLVHWLAPWWRERFRRLTGRQMVHEDPGGEWPTNTPWRLVPQADQEAIMAYAKRA